MPYAQHGVQVIAGGVGSELPIAQLHQSMRWERWNARCWYNGAIPQHEYSRPLRSQPPRSGTEAILIARWLEENGVDLSLNGFSHSMEPRVLLLGRIMVTP